MGRINPTINQKTLQTALDAELAQHLGCNKHSPTGKNTGNSRNGRSQKTIKGDFGKITLELPRDRNGSFEPQIIPKHQARFDGFDDKIIALYAKGMLPRDIQNTFKELYSVDIFNSLISRVTADILDEVKAWQAWSLEAIYPILYLDGMVVQIKQDSLVINKAAF